MDWYKFYWALYKADTIHLTLAEDGAYRRLIDAYYELRGPLPDNDRALARLVGCSINEWEAVSVNVRAFFDCKNGRLIHKRIDSELDAQDTRSKRLSEHARKAANARHRKPNDLDALSMPGACPEHAQPMPDSARGEEIERRSRGEERREEAEKTRAGARESGGSGGNGHLTVFDNMLHRGAYIEYRAEFDRPEDFDAALRQVNAPITGGTRYEWETIGAALVEMRGARARFGAAALRAFCQRLLRPEPVRSKTSPAAHGARQERNLAAVETWLKQTGGSDGK